MIPHTIAHRNPVSFYSAGLASHVSQRTNGLAQVTSEPPKAFRALANYRPHYNITHW